ncbi:hydroxymethylglutaryl-CoA synthase [Enterococcus diestrammenae]|uniref:hydroxymethylglutaryl-CoA synthase n=1 Tax=Enterococcus diestrammenae TaxID=1155073 RepID=UPI00195E73F8
MTAGIDKLNFFVPPYYLEMTELANARNVDPAKYTIGIGQDQMAISPITQDIITLAANAAQPILTDEDRQTIDLVILGTESSVDESKAAAVVLHRLLGIQPFARGIELKEACYSATAGLQFAKEYVLAHPERKALVIASDIARYGLHSGGEPTQGAGAVAMLVTSQPRILALSDESVPYTQDIYDFWRPTGEPYPVVNGPLSNQTYIQAFETVWQEYQQRYQKTLADFAALAFHIPYTKMGKKALLVGLAQESEAEQNRILAQYEESIRYSRRVGNLYTGSLYLGLISLLENSQTLKAGDQLGLFSYGSGAVAEFFTGRLVSGYQEHLLTDAHNALLANRQALSVAAYEEVFQTPLTNENLTASTDTTAFRLTAVNDHIRYYQE